MSTPTPTRRTLASTGILLLLIVGALWLRLLNLGSQSLWWDEANTYQAMNGSLLQAFDSITNDILSLPLDNLFLVLCAEGSPPDEFLFRLPAALFGVLCVPLTYVFARDLWGRRAGLVAAGLIAFSPYHIRYSQEARYYTSFAALHLLSLITLSRAISVPSRRRWGVYAVATAIMFYDQVFGFVAAGAQLALHGLYTTARAFSPMIRRWTNRPLPSGKSVHLRSVWFHGLALVGATLPLVALGADRLAIPRHFEQSGV